MEFDQAFNLRRVQEARHVLFSGGGVRGVAFSGCLSVLWNKHHIDWGQRCPALESVAGCSIGALYAFFICLGYTCNEIEDIAIKMKPNDFVDIDFTRIFPGKQMSLDSGECMKNLLIEWLMKKCPEISSHAEASKYTIETLSKRKKMDLRIYVTRINYRQGEVAHSSNSIIDSLLASMALPPIYSPVVLRNADGSSDYFADGGLANFFPLLKEPKGTLGFRLLQPPFTLSHVKKTAQPFLSYLTLALDIAISEKDDFQWNELSKEQKDCTLTIVCGTELGSMDLSINEKDHSEVFLAGCTAANYFLNGRCV